MSFREVRQQEAAGFWLSRRMSIDLYFQVMLPELSQVLTGNSLPLQAGVCLVGFPTATFLISPLAVRFLELPGSADGISLCTAAVVALPDQHVGPRLLTPSTLVLHVRGHGRAGDKKGVALLAHGPFHIWRDLDLSFARDAAEMGEQSIGRP